MARPQRSRPRLVVVQIVGAVVVLGIAVAIVLGVTHGSGQQPSAAPTATAATTAAAPADADVMKAVASVPASVFDAVGPGTASAAPEKITAPAVRQNGLPQVLYIGGEFCPYCAAERWPLAVALSRFGTLSGLGEISSAPAPEVYPETATLSFHGATLSSDYLALTAKEIYDRQHAKLDTLTPAEQKLLSSYDVSPYVQQAGAIPFVDIGGEWIISGAQYDPAVLKGKSHAQIAAALSDPKSPVAQAVIGTANVITVALCQQTAQRPAAVCDSAGVKAAAAAMGVK